MIGIVSKIVHDCASIFNCDKCPMKIKAGGCEWSLIDHLYIIFIKLELIRTFPDKWE